MKNKEDAFTRELEVFRTEIDKAIQYFYSRVTMNAIFSKDAAALAVVNKVPLFWTTISNALHDSFFIALGRIFDQGKTHNVDKLLSKAQENIDIFSKEALRARKFAGSPNAEWIDGYIHDAYVPTPDDFRKLRKYIDKHRRIYNRAYRIIRNQLIAHKAVLTPADVQAMYSGTNVKELEKLLVSLNKVHLALWQLYHNGRKPVLSNMKSSVRSMKETEVPKGKSTHTQEHAVNDTVKFFKLLKTVSK